MKSYFISYEAFKQKGGSIKTTTITYEELLAVLTMHMERLDKQFSLILNGHLPKPLHEILDDAFEQSHLYKAFYTQHCANRNYRYRSLSKNRVKVDFTLSYRMNRTDEKDMLGEMDAVLAKITTPAMSKLEKIVAVYDACLVGDELIYPHPKTAYLTAMSLNTLHTRKLEEIRVQYCTYANGLVYLSNYSDGATLYTYAVDTKELTKCGADQVTAIHQTASELVVTYENGKTEKIAIETYEAVECAATETPEIDSTRYTDVSMMSLGDSWLATFDPATEAFVAFKSADGVELYINEPVKQLTVSLEIDKGIQVQMTRNRKPVQFEQAVKLVLPIHLVENLVPSLQKHLDDQLTVTATTVIIQSQRNLMLQIKK